jgi:hypothetical protein
VREWINIGGVNGHNRIKQKSQVNTLGLYCKLERITVPVERPGAFLYGSGYAAFVGTAKQPIL